MTHPFENIPQRKSETISTIYTERFESWLKDAKEKGLQYVNIYYGDGYNKDTVNYESFCEEFINIKDAPNVSDREIF